MEFLFKKLLDDMVYIVHFPLEKIVFRRAYCSWKKRHKTTYYIQH